MEKENQKMIYDILEDEVFISKERNIESLETEIFSSMTDRQVIFMQQLKRYYLEIGFELGIFQERIKNIKI